MTSPPAPLRIELARIGISRAGHGLFWIGICLCAGVVVIGAAMLLFPHVGSTVKGTYVPPSHKAMPWPGWALMGAFAAASIGVTLGGINMGIRCAIIEVRGDRLWVEQKDLLGTRRVELRAEEIAAIDARHGAVRRRHKKTRRCQSQRRPRQDYRRALFIDLANGRTVRLLAGRDGNELGCYCRALARGAESRSRRPLAEAGMTRPRPARITKPLPAECGAAKHADASAA